MNYSKLSTESNKIIKFINSNDFNYNFKITAKSLKILKFYYEKLTKYYSIFKNNTNLVSNDVYKLSDEQIYQSLNNNIFARDLLKKEFVFNFCQYNLTFVNSFDNCKVSVKLDCENLNQELLLLVSKIVSVCLTLNYLTNNKTFLKLNLCFLKSKRELPSKFKVLGPAEINGGSTYRNSGEIDCWREQELFKVIIHEMIHSLNNDISYISSENINGFFKSFCIGNSTLIPNEAFTEIQARLFNIFIIHFEMYVRFNQISLHQLIEYEQKFSCIQSAKLLNFYGFKNLDGFFKNNGCNKVYNQETSIFSYVLITSALLNNLNIFLSYIHKNDLYLNKNDKVYNTVDIVKLFIQSIKKLSFKKNINLIINNIKKINKNKFIKSTFRMTSLEIN